MEGRDRTLRMEQRAYMLFLDKMIRLLNGILIWLAGLMLGAMIVLTCANIFLRTVWLPVSGTFELMGYFSAVAMAFALGHTQIAKGHISVDILVTRFSSGTRRFLNGVNNLVCGLFFGVVVWQIGKYGTPLWRTGEVTETLRIIYYPFTYAVGLGCALLSLVFLVEFLKSLLVKEEVH